MKHILVNIISVNFILDACKVSILNYLYFLSIYFLCIQVFLNFEKRVPDVKHAKMYKRFPQRHLQVYIVLLPL